MKVVIRELTIDTGAETDLVLVAAQVTQVARAWMQPAEPRQPRLVTPNPGPALGIEPPAAQPPAESPTPATTRSTHNGHVRRNGNSNKATDACECGETKLVTSRICRKCAARNAAAIRRSRRAS